MKQVLVVIPFTEIYPPMNGGKLRALNLLHQLSENFKVTAIIHQDAEVFSQAVKEYPSLKNCTVYSTKDSKASFDLFSLLPGRLRDAFRYRYWNRSLKGPTETNLLVIYPILKKLLKTQKFDFAVLEDMGILNVAKPICRYQPDTKVIYDAYNVNTRLAKTALDNGQMNNNEYEAIRQVETNLSEWVDGVFTCSEQDLSQLGEMNQGKISGTVVPNGVNLDLFSRATGGETFDRTNNILFCGSLDYFPNQEGLTWFCKEVFPSIRKNRPDARLLVVGKGDPGSELMALLKQDAIIFYGMVDNVSDYYKRATVALVPLLSGSGTRLKLLEAMGNKVAVVSTAIGAEGIDHTHRENILIADESLAFADAIIELLDKKDLAAKIAENAYLFVKGVYDWNVIGKNMAAYFNNYQDRKTR